MLTRDDFERQRRAVKEVERREGRQLLFASMATGRCDACGGQIIA